MSNAQQQSQEQKPKQGKGKKNQQPKLEFELSQVTDIFILTKGRERRNKQKKLDKICQTEMNIRQGNITEPNAAQKEMLAQKPAVMEEIKELNELLQLYVDANPNWNKKTIVVEEKKEEEVP